MTIGDGQTDLTIKRHDTWPSVQAELEFYDGDTATWNAIDLTDADQVKFIMKGNAVTVTGVCDIDADPTTGRVTYDWVDDDTAAADTYSMEFEIEWSNGKKETVPNDDYFKVVIKEDLDNA